MIKKYRRLKGQISIFLALVFIVMFTLFSMTVSMGMFIHDKINLQNATDLASYYVAGKQAELLGAIAHTNYQIRQSWKLLTFRYRVFGNIGRTNSSPPGIRNPGIVNNWNTHYLNENDYLPALWRPGAPPRLCIAADMIFNQFSSNNLCKTVGFSSPYLSTYSVAGFVSGASQVAGSVAGTNTALANNARAASYANWWFANMSYAAHKLEQRDRRALIEVLAVNLSQEIVEGGMKDLDGGDVYEGAQKTFIRNLSESNKENMSAVRVLFENSFSGVKREDWLKEIYVNVKVPFAHYNTTSSVSEEVRDHFQNPNYIASLLTSGDAQNLKAMVDPDPNPLTPIFRYGQAGKDGGDDRYNMIVGFEKSPWYMAYNRARGFAESHPVFLGAVFNDGISLQAESYAKPFGGRIGPWYFRSWPKGPESSGGGKVDLWLPKRVSKAEYGNFSGTVADGTTLPNYSRFPGDTKGLTTYSSMVAAGPLISWGIGASGTDVRDMSGVVYSYFNNEYNDPLSQNYRNNNRPAPDNGPDPIWDSYFRRLEIAAIAPDAFDVTHYSIVPGFYDYFIKDKLEKWVKPLLPQHVELRGDLGGLQGRESFDVLDQLNIYKEVQQIDAPKYAPKNVSRRRGPVPWFFELGVNNYVFLSSWNSGVEVMNYGPPSAIGGTRFAACLNTLEGKPNKPKIPSECLNGGRVGYSVKLISKDYINSSEHQLGGSSGSIYNQSL